LNASDFDASDFDASDFDASASNDCVPRIARLRSRPKRDHAMGIQKRIEVTSFSGSAGEVAMVQFLDRKIMDHAAIQELGDELLALVEKDQRKNLLLNFTGVEFLSSAALNKLIILNKRIKTLGGKLQLSNLRPEIFDVFAVTRLTQLFSIKKTEQEALATF
jgi:anti-sigma B factor antagonist